MCRLATLAACDVRGRVSAQHNTWVFCTFVRESFRTRRGNVET